MPDVKGTALLPKGEANAFVAFADELLKDPRRKRAALIIFDCKRGTEDYDQGDTVITVRIRRAEMLLTSDLPAAEKLIRRAAEARSDQPVLPLDVEDEITQVFKEMTNPTSPDDPDDPDPGDGKRKRTGK
jgi:hypothetical protein